ncbi:ATP phosphoribosyltransferase [Halarsenatibacter silvermanii]|uniref:ATP phosphoribosyltransferase n=2 Tax=Halarsenatibacter silvermanii TaxID=321763 RepID=A0A1G9NG43_9FIRM|nr:ATP phosphoribosyltransferase [Halarsenatibacter silvermanii]
MSMESLKIAIPKGRLYDEVVKACLNTDLLDDSQNISKLSRELVQEVSGTGNLFLLAKPADVPAYVEHGAADIGFTGKDVIAEKERRLYELLDLEIGTCDLVVAVPNDMDVNTLEDIKDNTRVATSYPGIAEKFFRDKNIKAEIIELNGSVELAPQVDLADIIVDITSTGTTLRKNDLSPIAEILSSSVRLVVNEASYRTKATAIDRLSRQLEKYLKKTGDN